MDFIHVYNYAYKSLQDRELRLLQKVLKFQQTIFSANYWAKLAFSYVANYL